ncbi:ABC transporter permease/substrate-binding protein [Campylobacter sp. CCUG 57310]|uniref:ABC transporter permease/substrate-binding protein n=1 Tax=Campylobacter sp. CCUG 57310 TaxID=2517362 RepID=UPI001567805E|nr:ABC transporter permease/substrate-binding protein [Campylobacter sp. CCUG 57310]QKF92620.1 glycine betaine/L-proline ABC transporter, permease/substrate-binding subunit, fused OpuBB/OpuBC [Campylobacter sp. CCUG 57310]
MSELFSTLYGRQDELVRAALEHLQISLSSLLLAIFIAIPLAIFISNHKRISEFVLQVAGIFQTIPSLALLGLFIPIFGIGAIPAIIALVIYALFPIVQNTLTGLREIDPALKEAARAFGMSKFERLKKFELALAMPVIISGIRTAAVMIIGTATLAALIGAGGLGTFVLLGIDRNDTSLILIGAISSALLAMIFSAGIKFLERQKLKLVITALATLLLALALSFVPNMSMQKDRIVIAAKLGAEPEILINLFKELIENETNLKVKLKANFGKTSFLYEALKSGDIDIYPEFTGTIVSSLLKAPSTNLSNDAKTVYVAAKEGLAKQDNLVLLEPLGFENTYALAVLRKFAHENNIKSISDLKSVQDGLAAGFTLEFNDREDGNLGLKSLYGLNLNVKTVEPALRYKAILSGEVQVIDAYSTDSEIREFDLVALKDDKRLFPPYEAAALMRQDTLDKYPQIGHALSKLNGKISSEQMSDMNYAVRVLKRSANDVAREYLVKNGLLK